MLGRPGCSLCDEAEAELEAFLAGWEDSRKNATGIEIEVVNIETDDELHRRYLERIPLILLDGEEVCEWVFEADAFEAALARRMQGPG